jgi:two-component system cell cycle sensor histidine kinase/response regulator CckA
LRSQRWPISRYERMSQALGVFVVVISAGALLGWFLGSPSVKGLRALYVPMAPNTAVVFLILGVLLAIVTSGLPRFRLAARVAIVLTITLVLARLGEDFKLFPPGVDHWIFRFPAQRIGLIEMGRMAFVTADTFLLLGAAFFLFTFSSHRWANNAAQGLSIVVSFIGLAFSLGYFYGAPLVNDGHSIPMALNTALCFFLSGVGLLIKASIRDITARQSGSDVLQKGHDELEARVNQRTAELLAQQEFLRTILDTSPSPIFVKDAEGRFTLVNKAVEGAYGRSAAEILGKTEADFNGNDNEIQVFVQDDREVISTLKPKFIAAEQLTNPMTGKTRSFQTIKVPLKLPGSETVQVLGVATDITDHIRVEQSLRESEERYRLLFESNPQPMWVYDIETLAFLAVNEAALFHYGYSRAEFLSMTIKDIRSAEDVPALLESVARMKPGLELAGAWKHRKKDGTIIDVEIVSHELMFAGRNAKLVLANDITERKRAERALHETEEQLRQSQKLEGIGKLAGGIAHDFNNLLTVISGYSDLLLRTGKLDESARDKMAEVNKAADRAASLTRQLLAFSRKQVLKPEILDLNSLVDGLGKMLQRLIGEDIEVKTSLRSEVAKISADPGQIEQVLINLVLNARDAMPGGGIITIETANVELDQAYSDLHIAVKAGAYVMLAVSDTGTGMDPETRKHIFEPFFTTKELGRGTGLGLSTIYGIVKQSGGNIWVYSELGKGTTFKIYLPQVSKPLTLEVAAVRSAPECIAAGGETILLVEDEEIVRKLACSILETHGYHVLVAQTGADAIEICRIHEGRIDLLLTDVVMPKMNGRKVAELGLQFRPDMEVLYMSGYTDDAIVHHGVLDAGTNYIEKPFTTATLTCKVGEAIRNARAESTSDSQR